MAQPAIKQNDIVKLAVPAYFAGKTSLPKNQFIVLGVNKNIFRMVKNEFLHFISPTEQYRWTTYIINYEIELWD